MPTIASRKVPQMSPFFFEAYATPTRPCRKWRTYYTANRRYDSDNAKGSMDTAVGLNRHNVTQGVWKLTPKLASE